MASSLEPMMRTHWHRPRTIRTYYNSMIITNTICADCGQQLRRYVERSSGDGLENADLLSFSDNLYLLDITYNIEA